jgi:hypothetical protein
MLDAKLHTNQSSQVWRFCGSREKNRFDIIGESGGIMHS